MHRPRLLFVSLDSPTTRRRAWRWRRDSHQLPHSAVRTATHGNIRGPYGSLRARASPGSEGTYTAPVSPILPRLECSWAPAGFRNGRRRPARAVHTLAVPTGGRRTVLPDVLWWVAHWASPLEPP